MFTKENLILASASPRRKILLKKIGMNFLSIASNIQEDLQLKLPPEAMSEHWAREKAKYIAEKYPNSLIIGADTIITLKNKILGKPKNKSESFDMLSSLSGETHEVITGMSFLNIKKKIDFTFNERTYVSIKSLTHKEIHFYIDNYITHDKAGSYGIQDFFAVHVKKITGCYYNIMGLPLASFYKNFKSI